MNQKISICDVKTEWLNKKALVLISIFASAANKLEEKPIDLLSEDVLKSVCALAKQTNNSELIDIYQRIKLEIKKSLTEINVIKEASEEVAKLSVYNDVTESQKQYVNA